LWGLALAIATGTVGALTAAAELSAVERPRPFTVALFLAVAVGGYGLAVAGWAYQQRDRRRAIRRTKLAKEGRHGRLFRVETGGPGFVGRTRAIDRLIGWLAESWASGSSICVVTGGPGSGKSAVLSRLVTLVGGGAGGHEHDMRQTARPQVALPRGARLLFVDATEESLEQLVARLANANDLAAASAQGLVEQLVARRQPLLVVFDALDAAIDPTRIARQLIRVLAGDGENLIRVLVGAGRDLQGKFETAFQIDLDDPTYFALDDLIDYVQLLLREDGPTGRSPYRQRPAAARHVAAAVATRARPSFLVAKLVALSLVRREEDEVATIGAAGESRFPATVHEAMDTYLGGFGTEEQRIRDLLRPLAFAKGAGLPADEVWAILASCLGTRSYEAADTRWLLESPARRLLAQHDLRGLPAYRLFHEAMAEYLRKITPLPEYEVQRRYTQILLEAVPEAERGGRDWLAAHPYLAANLIVHASQGGLLDPLLEDPDYVVTADPSRLLQMLPGATSSAAQRVEQLYRRHGPRLRQQPPGERAAYLELTARHRGDDEVAERFRNIAIERPWALCWTHRHFSDEHRVLGEHPEFVESVATGLLDGRPVVVSGGGNGELRTWDLETGGGGWRATSRRPYGDRGGRDWLSRRSHDCNSGW
jgi:AAA ATPase domain